MGKQARAKQWLILTLATAFLMALLAQWPRLVDPYLVIEDFRNLYWVHRFTDPTLFQNDPAIGYQMAQLGGGKFPWTVTIHRLSPVYSLLLGPASHFFSPIFFSKLLVFPLLLIAVYYLYRLGLTIAGPGTAFALGLVFSALNLIPSLGFSVTSGLQRAFTLPLLLALVYYLSQGRNKAAAIVVALSVIYPPIFLLGTTTYALSVIQRVPAGKWPFTIAWKQAIPLFIAALIGALTLLPALGAQGGNSAASSTIFPQQHILFDPNYQQGGRYPLFAIFPLIGPGGVIEFGMDVLLSILFLVLLLPIWLLLRSRAKPLPPSLWRLFYASWICYLTSWLAILATSSLILHMPNRYTRGALFLLPLVFIVTNAPEAISTAARMLGGRRKEPVGFPAEKRLVNLSAGPFFWLAAIPAIAIALGAALWSQGIRSGFYRPSDDTLALLAYVETLPPNSLLAGSPCSLNDIPLYAKRTVLFSCETPNPDSKITLDTLRAYYASSLDQVYQFCRNYGVDYLVVNRKDYTKESMQEGHYFYEPFNSYLLPELKDRSVFALNEVPEDAKLFQLKDLLVVACRT